MGYRVMDNDLILHLGVIDSQYKNGQMVGDVAGYLESKYDVMKIFSDMHKDDIEQALIDSLLDTPISSETNLPPFSQAAEKIKDLFSIYINNAEHGIKTKAAELGVTKRKKQQSGHDERVSFVDTGLYRGSFIVWVD